MRVTLRFGVAAVGGIALLTSVRPAAAHGEDAAAVTLLVIGGTNVLATTYDVAKIAQNEPPALVWAYPEAVYGSLFAVTTGVVATEENTSSSGLLFLVGEGWFAAIGGYAIGGIAHRRARAALVGGAVGPLGVSYHQMFLTLIGKPTDPSASIAQAALSTPAILGGTIWAIDASSRGDRVGYITLASLGGLALLHGVTAAAITHAKPSERSPESATFAPSIAIVPTAHAGWELSVVGTW